MTMTLSGRKKSKSYNWIIFPTWGALLLLKCLQNFWTFLLGLESPMKKKIHLEKAEAVNNQQRFCGKKINFSHPVYQIRFWHQKQYAKKFRKILGMTFKMSKEPITSRSENYVGLAPIYTIFPKTWNGKKSWSSPLLSKGFKEYNLSYGIPYDSNT